MKGKFCLATLHYKRILQINKNQLILRNQVGTVFRSDRFNVTSVLVINSVKQNSFPNSKTSIMLLILGTQLYKNICSDTNL